MLMTFIVYTLQARFSRSCYGPTPTRLRDNKL